MEAHTCADNHSLSRCPLQCHSPDRKIASKAAEFGWPSIAMLKSRRHRQYFSSSAVACGALRHAAARSR